MARPGEIEEVVRSERDGPLVRLTLDRPAKLNALDDRVRRGLHGALAEVAEDPSVRVVILQGAGRSFSAGADLVSGAPEGDDWAARRHLAGAWQRLIALLDGIPQVTIARLHGHVVGGAVLLAAACDLRVGDPDVRLRIPELELGIPLTWAGNPLLAREIGLPWARDWVMTGREVDADEAHRVGFIQRLAPEGALDRALDELVAQLLAMPAAPLAMTKASFAALAAATGHAELGWADPDLLRWSQGEPEGRDAALGYVERLRGGDT